MPRFFKQSIYAVFYLAVAGLIGYGIYSLLIQPAPTCFDNRQNQGEEGVDCGGPCASCELQKLKPIQAGVEIFGIGDSTNAVLNFSNPNITYGAQSFTYTLNFYGAAREKIFSLTKTSFIYPAEAKKVVIEPNLKIDFSKIVGTPEIIISAPTYKSAEEYSEPKTQFRQVKTEISGSIATITGILANRESFKISRAGIGAVTAQKATGKLAGASKTVLFDIRPFEERAFKIIIPLNAIVRLNELETAVFAEVSK
ncbi:MAG: hypothetical protein A3E64_00085 [Candidatus Harrisonbacteria bacterium RIFCSPHIGHO2_12_FULL_48_16]|nr:MAG: hypothetical protein A3E64_00085 [Candidatus Harrisonbacteria bacterium RIFCSPHIGHO2_12_FULL_48_16]